jgi:glycosyltransferase involved in cell wall biosynthesis
VRVVHLVEGLDAVGGVPTYLADLLPALRTEGIEGVVFTADHTTSFGGAPCVHVPAVGCDRAQLGARERADLASALSESGADLAYAHVTRSAALLDAVTEQVPTIFYAHDYYAVCPGSMRYLQNSERLCTEGVGLRCFRRAYTERCTNRRPDRIVRDYLRVKGWADIWPKLSRVFVASQFVADLLVADGVAAEAISVVPYFVATPPAESRATENDVVFIGRLVGPKGVEWLARALARLDGVTAVIAGDGPDRAALELMVSELGIAERVRFVGWISPASRQHLLETSKIAVVPSLWDEPFGIVGIEALAAGVPVVGGAVGGIPSWLEDGVTGSLVPRGDVGALAAALGRLLTDEQLRESYSGAARASAARFSLKRHLELLLPELRAAASGGAAPGLVPAGR